MESNDEKLALTGDNTDDNGVTASDVGKEDPDAVTRAEAPSAADALNTDESAAADKPASADGVALNPAEAENDKRKKGKKAHGKLFNAVKVFGFILLILAINAAMYFGGRPDIPGVLHSYRTYQLNRMFSERKNSIDVVYVGHSGVHCGVTPMEIYDKYGIAGYSLSQPLMLPWESYETVVDLLEEQDLKVIALEVNAFFYDLTEDFFNSYAKRVTLSVFPFYESHLWWRDGFKRAARDPYKNFPFYSKAVPYSGEVKRDKGDGKIYKMHAKHKKYLKKYVELCEKRGIKLVLFELPVITYWSWERHNCIKKFVGDEKNHIGGEPIPFFDMNVDEAADKVNIDWKSDYLDAGDHLNYYGAVKSSRVLGEWLRDTYGGENGVLPYRKDTPEYADWDADLKKYKEKAATMPEREPKEEQNDVA